MPNKVQNYTYLPHLANSMPHFYYILLILVYFTFPINLLRHLKSLSAFRHKVHDNLTFCDHFVVTLRSKISISGIRRYKQIGFQKDRLPYPDYISAACCGWCHKHICGKLRLRQCQHSRLFRIFRKAILLDWTVGAAWCSYTLGRQLVFDTYAYPIYFAILLLLLVTIFIAPNIKGSHSWIVLGPVSLQPAEFAKFATALALAKLFSGYNFSLNAKFSNYIKAAAIIMAPIMLILLQNETGSALVFTSLVFVLYREGMSGLILFAGLCSIVISWWR